MQKRSAMSSKAGERGSLGSRQVEVLDVEKEERDCQRIGQVETYMGKKKEALALAYGIIIGS